MRLLRNGGTNRGMDGPREWLTPETTVDLASPAFSALTFAEREDVSDREER